MSTREFGIEVNIDPNDILNENLTHASRCQYYGDRLAEAILERDTAKSFLKVVEAELNDKIMRSWQSEFEKFPTESMRDGWVTMQPKHKIAVDKLNKAEYHVNLLKSADKAFDARGYSLGNVTSILVSGFDSVPKVGKSIQQHQRVEDIKNTKVDMRKPVVKKLIKKPKRTGN